MGGLEDSQLAMNLQRGDDLLAVPGPSDDLDDADTAPLLRVI